ncbi:prepilin peptidase [Leucobacter massiliensis]|uniref:Prepilin type IV endopeptidase peptidase domain-containing protein n=1 Tax=Leucobacter massiliensis TaxID=1686285 RepID=A0A2S9QMI7_9MICO|nr:prepilin peptidase [Leucobacter massiliensis]PRI10809.1 hypothetical protein B4915_07895 [Leucobacter massiliensis]
MAWAAGGAAVLAHVLFAALSLRLALIDLRERRLPNGLLALGTAGVAALLVAAAGLEARWDRLLPAGSAAAGYGAALVLLWLAARGALGAGDVKLAPVLGLVLGWSGPEAALLWGPLGIAAACAVAAVAARLRRRSVFALGPALLAGAWCGLSLAALGG